MPTGIEYTLKKVLHIYIVNYGLYSIYAYITAPCNFCYFTGTVFHAFSVFNWYSDVEHGHGDSTYDLLLFY